MAPIDYEEDIEDEEEDEEEEEAPRSRKRSSKKWKVRPNDESFGKDFLRTFRLMFAFVFLLFRTPPSPSVR
jgi:hypothetical protein